jgi:hypothetical protein
MNIRDAVSTVFLKDLDVVGLYDPNVPVETTSDVVDSIELKLAEWCDMADCQMAYEDWGYVFWVGNILISFGISPDNRDDLHKSKLWELITKNLGDDFYCFLWTRNQRAIKWLIKMGMSSELIDNNKITKLRLCH